jgi:hypothetical protein
MEEQTQQKLKEKIAIIAQFYHDRKKCNSLSFDDVIGPDVMMSLSIEDSNKIKKMLNCNDGR